MVPVTPSFLFLLAGAVFHICLKTAVLHFAGFFFGVLHIKIKHVLFLLLNIKEYICDGNRRVHFLLLSQKRRILRRLVILVPSATLRSLLVGCNKARKGCCIPPPQSVLYHSKHTHTLTHTPKTLISSSSDGLQGCQFHRLDRENESKEAV